MFLYFRMILSNDIRHEKKINFRDLNPSSNTILFRAMPECRLNIKSNCQVTLEQIVLCLMNINQFLRRRTGARFKLRQSVF